MNLLWDISEKKYDSSEIYTREAAERHRRLRTPERRQIVAPVVKAAPEPSVTPWRPRKVADLPKPRDKSQKDAHVDAYRAWQVETSGSPCKAYIMRRAADFGFTYSEIIGHSRFNKLVEPRHQIIWEIKRQVKPSITYPELGRLFGGRDHSSAIFAVKKYDKIMGWEAGE